MPKYCSRWSRLSLSLRENGLRLEQDLEAAGRPAQLLLGVRLDGGRGVPDGQHGGDVGGLPAILVQLQRGPDVLGLRLGPHATDLLDGGAAVDHVGADGEGRVEAVLARLDEPVEHRLHVAGTAGDQVVEVSVGLRGLHEGDIGFREERHRLVQEIRRGHEVRIQDDEVFTRGDRQRIVDIAGLGAGVALTNDVLGAEFGSQGADVIGLAVVEHVGDVLAVHRDCGGHGGADLVQFLTVGGDVDIDRHLGLVQVHRKLREIRARLDVLVLRTVEPGLRIVEAISTRVVTTGKNGPQGEQRLQDDDGLGRQHDQVRNPVTAIGEVEEEGRVEQDTDGGDQHQHHQ